MMKINSIYINLMFTIEYMNNGKTNNKITRLLNNALYFMPDISLHRLLVFLEK